MTIFGGLLLTMTIVVILLEARSRSKPRQQVPDTPRRPATFIDRAPGQPELLTPPRARAVRPFPSTLSPGLHLIYRCFAPLVWLVLATFSMRAPSAKSLKPISFWEAVLGGLRLFALFVAVASWLLMLDPYESHLPKLFLRFFLSLATVFIADALYGLAAPPLHPDNAGSLRTAKRYSWLNTAVLFLAAVPILDNPELERNPVMIVLGLVISVAAVVTLAALALTGMLYARHECRSDKQSDLKIFDPKLDDSRRVKRLRLIRNLVLALLLLCLPLGYASATSRRSLYLYLAVHFLFLTVVIDWRLPCNTRRWMRLPALAVICAVAPVLVFWAIPAIPNWLAMGAVIEAPLDSFGSDSPIPVTTEDGATAMIFSRATSGAEALGRIRHYDISDYDGYFWELAPTLFFKRAELTTLQSLLRARALIVEDKLQFFTERVEILTVQGKKMKKTCNIERFGEYKECPTFSSHLDEIQQAECYRLKTEDLAKIIANGQEVTASLLRQITCNIEGARTLPPKDAADLLGGIATVMDGYRIEITSSIEDPTMPKFSLEQAWDMIQDPTPSPTPEPQYSPLPEVTPPSENDWPHKGARSAKFIPTATPGPNSPPTPSSRTQKNPAKAPSKSTRTMSWTVIVPDTEDSSAEESVSPERSRSVSGEEV